MMLPLWWWRAWRSFGLKQEHVFVPFAFLTGGFISGLAGFFRMGTATRASNRTAHRRIPSCDGR
jgi:Na+/H+-translocating membrane pyrophosphatase